MIYLVDMLVMDPNILRDSILVPLPLSLHVLLRIMNDMYLSVSFGPYMGQST
jgi:hypothetical protein